MRAGLASISRASTTSALLRSLPSYTPSHHFGAASYRKKRCLSTFQRQAASYRPLQGQAPDHSLQRFYPAYSATNPIDMTQTDSKSQLDATKDAVTKQGEVVKKLKLEKASKEQIQPEVDKLVALKEQLKQLSLKEDGADKFDRATLESVLLKRFFYAPSFEIYGGIAGLYDYGPPGCALQNNILTLWRQHFVLEEDMLEVECTNLTPEAVLKTSGHVERFADYMVKDVKSGDIFRADHLVKQVLSSRLEYDTKLAAGTAPKLAKGQAKVEPLSADVRKDYEMVLETLDNYVGDELTKLIRRLDIRAPTTGNEVTDPVMFNLMFETQIGPTGQFKGYLRPETAQGHFLNFKRLYEFNTGQVPFASASVGKSFRNEISPRQGLLRVREFTMAEIEHYVDPTNKKHARFGEVKDLVVPLYSATAQEAAAGPTKMTIGEAVESGVINNQTLGYFVARIYLFLTRIGIDPERLRMRQHMSNEMAHYACDCWDAEIKSSYGWIECVGCADRSAYDLTAHTNKTGEKLVVRETLPEPIIEDKVVLEVNKKNFGPAFKKDAKAVQGYLDSLKTGDSWNEAELLKLKSEIDANGKVSVTGTDGKQYELTGSLVTIEKKTIKSHIREYIPSVIEPSFGIGRILYQLLEHAYYRRESDDEARHVLRFPAAVAPIKALVLPISHSDEFTPYIKEIVTSLRRCNIANKVDDSASSIGKRYSRNDELGTPFAVTVDFQTVQDQTVTLRERDSMLQIRGKIADIVDIVKNLVEEKTTWAEVQASNPAFSEQAL